ncbi:hypothetical protein KGF57_002539 [Candida theae]|uniref:Uncharacterized protein n=1 Tax=Candida theae TaxID=1198502 RepID=A0AAD5FYK1_9ASCO|nr:uncharacterized protein KGF57_002539 [Candida theae]KAI5958184.1 hypothetical protein KGF57_002539 [Candida theae]
MDFDYENNHFANEIELKDAKEESHSNNMEHINLSGDDTHCFTVEPHANINFSSVEWEYLQIAQESLQHHHQHTSHSSGLEISPSVSNHTSQSMGPTFTTEYDTDNTELLGMLESQNPSNLYLSANQQCASNDSLLHHSANTNKTNNEFTFENHLDSSYWEYLLGKESNMLEDSKDLLDSNVITRHHVECNEEEKIDDRLKDGTMNSAVCSTCTLEEDELAGYSIYHNEDDQIMQYNSNDEMGENNLEEKCVWDERLTYERYDQAENTNFFSDPIALQLSVTSSSPQPPPRPRPRQRQRQRPQSSASASASASVEPLARVLSPKRKNGRYITAPIYEWPDDETTGSSKFYNKMKVRLSTLEPKCVSETVLKTIREEFVVQDLFLSGESPPSPEVPESIRKRSDRDVEWTPLSVYKAYTNIKSPTNGRESYNRLVPYSSCIGTLNYRPKDHAAWKRAPNKRQ